MVDASQYLQGQIKQLKNTTMVIFLVLAIAGGVIILSGFIGGRIALFIDIAVGIVMEGLSFILWQASRYRAGQSVIGMPSPNTNTNTEAQPSVITCKNCGQPTMAIIHTDKVKQHQVLRCSNCGRQTTTMLGNVRAVVNVAYEGDPTLAKKAGGVLKKLGANASSLHFADGSLLGIEPKTPKPQAPREKPKENDDSDAFGKAFAAAYKEAHKDD